MWYNLIRIKKIIMLALLLISWNTLLSMSSTAVGVNLSKVVILEYWKFENSKSTNEMIIYNPTDTDIEIVFKNCSHNDSYLKSDTLLIVQNIKPNQYVLFREISGKFRKLDDEVIEVLINGKSAGLYVTHVKRNEPFSKINSGIIINQRANVGSFQPFEIIYEKLNFNGSELQNIDIAFGESKFKSVSFSKGKEYNHGNINLTNIKAEKLNILHKNNDDLFLTSTGEKGKLKLTINDSNTKKKLKYRSLYYYYTNTHGMGFLLFKFNHIDFGTKRKYKD